MTKRILIVDDEQDIREIVQLCLEDVADWQVILAESGSEGLQLSRTEQPDAILLDMSMPEMDGFELFEQLREDPTTCHIPIILVTAKVLPSDLRQFDAMDFAGVITKPFAPETISIQMAEILGWSASEY